MSWTPFLKRNSLYQEKLFQSWNQKLKECVVGKFSEPYLVSSARDLFLFWIPTPMQGEPVYFYYVYMITLIYY